MKTIYVCHCGSPRVLQDAYKHVNTGLVTTYDNWVCDDCGSEDPYLNEVEVPDDFDLDTDTYTKPETKDPSL